MYLVWQEQLRNPESFSQILELDQFEMQFLVTLEMGEEVWNSLCWSNLNGRNSGLS
jgi:hypothetical protein